MDAGSVPPAAGRGHELHRISWGVGGPGDDGVWALAVDRAGNVIVGGTFVCELRKDGTVLADGVADTEGFVASFDDTGAPRWARVFGGAGTNVVVSLAVDDRDRIYVGGSFDGALRVDGRRHDAQGWDGFVARLSESGSIDWLQPFAGPGYQNVRSVAVSAGTLAVTGAYDGRLALGSDDEVTSDEPQAFLALLDLDGDASWLRSYGSASGPDTGKVVAVRDARIALSGESHRLGIDLGGGPIDDSRTFLGVFGLDGEHLWSTPLGGRGPVNTSISLAIGGDGSIFTGGLCQGSFEHAGRELRCGGTSASMHSDGIVSAFDGSGRHAWDRVFSGELESAVEGLAVTADDGLIAAGSFGGTVDFGDGAVTAVEGDGHYDVYVVGLDVGGGHRFTYTAGSYGSDGADAVAQAPDGTIWVAGSFRGPIDFGGGAIVPNGERDGFLLALRP